MKKQEFINGGAGFTAESFDKDAPNNALINDSKNFWFSADGELESCAGTIKATPSIAGDVAMLFGDGYATIGTGGGTAVGNIAKYIGNAALFVTNDDINIIDPSLDGSPINIPFAGSGAVPPLIATSPLVAGVPYIAPWNPDLQEYQAPVPLGVLPQEEAPELIVPLSLGSGFTGKNNGTYAVKAAYVRKDTGGVSLTSPASNTLAVVNSSLLARFPLPTTPRYTRNSPLAWDTNDFWLLYSTPVNFGNTTVYLFLREVNERKLAAESYTNWTAVAGASDTTITLTAEQLSYLFTAGEISDDLVGKTVTSGSDSGVITEVISLTQFKVGSVFVATSGSSLTIGSNITGFSDERLIELEWTENDLIGEIPDINFYPPYTSEEFFDPSFGNICKFIVPLNNVVLLVGTDDGTGIKVSVPNFIEAFPPDYVIHLPETPVGVSYRAEDGYCYVFCKNSVHEIRWTGAVAGAPVAIRTITTSVGTVSQKSFFNANGVLYMLTPDRRVVRVVPGAENDARYDYVFSEPVQSYIKNWNPFNVSLAFDERHNAICLFHEREFLAYHQNLEAWSCPIDWDDFVPSVNVPNGDINNAITYRGVIHLFDTNTSETFLLDRDLAGNEATEICSAVLRFQWNSFNEEFFGKDIKQVQAIASGLDGTTVTVEFYGDLKGSTLGSSGTLVFPAGEKISRLLDRNNGTGRLISTKLSIAACSRATFSFLRLQYNSIRIRSNF